MSHNMQVKKLGQTKKICILWFQKTSFIVFRTPEAGPDREVGHSGPVLSHMTCTSQLLPYLLNICDVIKCF